MGLPSPMSTAPFLGTPITNEHSPIPWVAVHREKAESNPGVSAQDVSLEVTKSVQLRYNLGTV